MSCGGGHLVHVPIHEIAAVCYIKDDGLHTLAIKYGMYYTFKYTIDSYWPQQKTIIVYN
jgi:hypothetical protein